MVRHRVTQSGTLTFPSRQSPQHQGNLIFSTGVLRGAEAGREPEPGANFNVLLLGRKMLVAPAAYGRSYRNNDVEDEER